MHNRRLSHRNMRLANDDDLTHVTEISITHPRHTQDCALHLISPRFRPSLRVADLQRLRDISVQPWSYTCSRASPLPTVILPKPEPFLPTVTRKKRRQRNPENTLLRNPPRSARRLSNSPKYPPSMSLSSSLRHFSPKLPFSFPSPKLTPKTTPFLFSRTPSSKTLSKTHFSSSLSPHPSHPSSPASDPLSEPLIPPSLQSIIGLFQSAQDSRARYLQILHYGQQLRPLQPQFKTPENKVQGCVSQVWVHAFLDDDGNVRFEADSDAAITKGLAALLVRGLSGHPAPEIVRIPPDFIKELGLGLKLTASRNNGLLNMLLLMQRKALELHVKAAGGGNAADSGVLGVENGADVAAGGDSVERSDLGIGEQDASGLNGGTSLSSDDVRSIDEIQSNSEVGVALGSRGLRIRERLQQELFPVELEVEDISYQHTGHAGVRGSDGETHFNVRIVSKEFEGKSLLKRHRLVYGVLQEELNSGLHALSIDAKTPSEVGGS
ncbi:hypothetical protein ACLOJK_015975 [Asimina triloba]